jgi:hypothetical protein
MAAAAVKKIELRKDGCREIQVQTILVDGVDGRPASTGGIWKTC